MMKGKVTETDQCDQVREEFCLSDSNDAVNNQESLNSTRERQEIESKTNKPKVRKAEGRKSGEWRTAKRDLPRPQHCRKSNQHYSEVE
jgi:hypothetical protein